MFHVKHHSDEIEYMCRIVSGWGIDISEEKKGMFALYKDTLVRWNKKVHLISRGDEEKVVRKHFLESLVLLWLFDFQKEKKMMDLGAGAGFPSLPLKILFKDISLLLVETNRKKSLFLEEIIDILGLKDVLILCERVENLIEGRKLAGSFDIITARAVAPINKVIRLSLPFLKEKSGVLAVPYAVGKEIIIKDDLKKNITMKERIVKIDTERRLRILLFYK